MSGERIQAFGCVLGFDWHSSGVTITVCGALKEGLRGIEGDVGLYVAGGKGGTSRKPPGEIQRAADTLLAHGKQALHTIGLLLAQTGSEAQNHRSICI